MFKFRDDSYIEGQLDLCNLVNDKYPALTEFFDNEKGYDIVDYNRRSTTSIEKVVYEAGVSTNYHSDFRDVIAYWRNRGYLKGDAAQLHKFHYTNDTGKTGKVYITVYDHFQNNALDGYDWSGNYQGYYGSMGPSSASFYYDSDIDVRVTAYRNYGATSRIEEYEVEIPYTIPVHSQQKNYVYYFDDDSRIGVIHSDSTSSGKESSNSSRGSGSISWSSNDLGHDGNLGPSGGGYSNGGSSIWDNSGTLYEDEGSSSSEAYYDPTYMGGWFGGGWVSSPNKNVTRYRDNKGQEYELYSDSKGIYYWKDTWTTKKVTRKEKRTKLVTSGDDYFTRDCPDNQVYTFLFCTLNPGDILDVWLEGEDYACLPDPASYLKVEITFDGSYVEVSPEIPEKTDGNKIEASGFTNDMNFDWGRQEVASALINDMQFGWGADLTDNGVATDMQWRKE